LAPALLTLLQQLERDYPGTGWLNSPQTGTIGDAKHQAQDSSSDHNPWLDNTVRALDVAADVSGVPGIVTVTDAPDCEALFGMVNQMYAAKDPRVWPNGYAIFKGRITDWNNPGGFHEQQGDPHLYHLHISVSQNPDGYNSTAPWPLPGESGSSAGDVPIGEDMPLTEDDWKRLQDLMQTMINDALLSQRAWITAAYGGVPGALSEFKPEIVGSTKRLRDTAAALAGQLPELPDGTKITSISVAHAEELSAIAKLQAQLTGSRAVAGGQGGQGGDPAAGGADGAQPPVQSS
ncbi:MAG TPA: hypothetical protein VFU36_17650, partial [Jatrophihabitans sp.]|nr:hypothetical protein [Jatrophihabitans sp.]